MAHTENMKRADVPRSGPALGGIGAGSVELYKDGTFRNWTIFNNEPLFAGPKISVQDDQTLFFFVRWEEAGKHPQMRMLQIESPRPHPNGLGLQFYTFRWIQGVEEIKSSVRWPITQMQFIDEAMPFDIELEAFSSFVPNDVKNSSLPGAFFTFKITPKTTKKVDLLLVANLQHMAGIQEPQRAYNGKPVKLKGASGFEFSADNLDKKDPSNGELCMLSSDPKNTTHHLGWSHRHTFIEPLLHQQELSGTLEIKGQNKKDEKSGKMVAEHPCFGSLGWRKKLGGSRKPVEHTFTLSWNFPNAYAGQTKKEKQKGNTENSRMEGHYYNNFFSKAAQVGEYLIAQRKKLRTETAAFVDAFYKTSLPEEVLNLINAQLNTFFTSTWLNKDGDYGIQEGLTEETAWGPLATIDVGMYGSIASLGLFPELDRSQWEVHRRLQRSSGDISHGVGRDFSKGDADEGVKSRLDLAPQYVVQVIRHYLFTNDKNWLKEFWPSIRKAYRYSAEKRDLDGDGLPEMNGSNSSYDNFPMFGPATYVASQYIAALQHAEIAAVELGEMEEAAFIRQKLDQAQQGFEKKLWNGNYFSLYNDKGGNHGGHDDACLSDQIIGQWANHMTCAGDICSPAKIKKALNYVIKRNLHKGEGLYNCRWPEDDWLHPVAESCWFDQANTFWTGVELAFVSFLAYEGKTKQALQLAKDVEERYRLANRTWDHMEWGGHYYRPMSAWAILYGFAGLSWKADTLTIAPTLKDQNLTFLITHSGGYGLYEKSVSKSSEIIFLQSEKGSFDLKTLNLGITLKDASKAKLRLGRKAITDATVEIKGKEISITFKRKIKISPNAALTVTVN